MDMPITTLRIRCVLRSIGMRSRRATVEGGAKSLSGSSYYISSLLSISTVDAIEALNAISGGEDIPAATIGVDGTSSHYEELLLWNNQDASYLTVGGETTV
ncbi:hypothetical protein RND71_040496 [Anisodus tanguticus]|uniref:Uncharacterized protein n=1 Tax=Anisodus tanguticus TaxID=243964 RepID=A0AAE1QTM0_9SOLA|nr:hypothetical protein RND71_040496 [Anisodus tanguticus]